MFMLHVLLWMAANTTMVGHFTARPPTGGAAAARSAAAAPSAHPTIPVRAAASCPQEKSTHKTILGGRQIQVAAHKEWGCRRHWVYNAAHRVETPGAAPATTVRVAVAIM